MNALASRASYCRIALAALVFCVSASPGYTQWLTHRTPGIPRNADGMPKLTAPPARLADGRPDLQGLWTVPFGSTAIPPAPEVLQPWAQDVMQKRHEALFRERPAYRCLPSGPEVNAGWKRIVQTPAMVAILNENQTYRTIFLDGRTLEPDPHPTWMGYSVGRWEGDTLVVESIGFNDKTWLNPLGLPHTTSLRVVERYTRRTVGRMELELTLSDPGTFTRPWTTTVPMVLQVDTEMLETVCEEGSDNWAGTLAEIRTGAVPVSREILTRYVGVYRGMWGPNVRTVRVRLDGDILRANGIHDQDVQLIPESATFFAGTDGLTYEFVGAGNGRATHLIERHVSGDYTYARQD